MRQQNWLWTILNAGVRWVTASHGGVCIWVWASLRKTPPGWSIHSTWWTSSLCNRSKWSSLIIIISSTNCPIAIWWVLKNFWKYILSYHPNFMLVKPLTMSDKFRESRYSHLVFYHLCAIFPLTTSHGHHLPWLLLRGNSWSPTSRKTDKSHPWLTLH